ncbi:MAG: hypothetical protein P8L20_11800 [Flavobacteriales bacterium]|nr:hypothetical protein [Flavobacteriales bacterium]
MKKYNLFLDDVRSPYSVFFKTLIPLYEHNSDWIIVKDYSAFVSHIEKHGIPTVLSLDHDLSQNHYLPHNQEDIDYSSMDIPSGWHCLKWLIEHCKNNNSTLPQIFFHTQNKQGEQNMRALMLE